MSKLYNKASRENNRLYTIRTSVGRKRYISRRTHSSQRFFNILGSINFRNSRLKAYIKVDYGDGFVNEGSYTNKKDLIHAARAFNEKD